MVEHLVQVMRSTRMLAPAIDLPTPFRPRFPFSSPRKQPEFLREKGGSMDDQCRKFRGSENPHGSVAEG